MALSDFDTPSDWAADLDRRWQERKPIRDLLLATIGNEFARNAEPRLLELGIGDGQLLSNLRRELPNAHLIGVDLEPRLIEHARDLVEGCELYVRDLNDSSWFGDIPRPIDLVFSLQTFHDLGGYEALRAMYEGLHTLLAPGGLVLNADFVVPQKHDDPDNPRRFAFNTHCALLTEIGFDDVRCLISAGDLACISARRVNA